MNIDPNNKSICSYLWSSVCIREGGRVLPCCLFDDTESTGRLQDYNMSLSEAYNSPYYKNMRENALKGIENPGCQRCYFRERETGRSLRLRALHEGHPQFDHSHSSLENVTYLEIFLGNLCNLKCLMCAPQLSSSLAADYVALGLEDESKKKIYEMDYTSILRDLPHLDRLRFVGGEPLLIKAHWELLDSIPADRAKKIILEYNTNCTIFPDAEKIKIWQKFLGIETILSIDGYGKVNEYIRFPSKWPIVEKNAKLFKAFLTGNPHNTFGLNAAITIYNIFSLKKLTDWAHDNFGEIKDRHGSSTFFLSSSSSPNYLSIQHLPLETKTDLLRYYPDTDLYSLVRATLKTKGDISQMKIFKEKTEAFDKLRKVSCVDYIPDMKPVLEAQYG